MNMICIRFIAFIAHTEHRGRKLLKTLRTLTVGMYVKKRAKRY